MALPYTLDLAIVDASQTDEFAIKHWDGSVPAARTTSTATATIDVQLLGQGSGADLFVTMELGGETRVDFVDELETARLKFQNADGTQDLYSWEFSDRSDPYSFRIPWAAAQTWLAYTGALRLRFEDPHQPIDADPGTVSAGSPTATLSVDVRGPLPVNADPGAVSAGAPSAEMRAEGAVDPVNADPGTVSAGSPTATLSVEPFAAFPVDADPGTVSAAAPTASLRAARRTATVNADPGAVSAGAPTATLRAEIAGAEVDADPGTVSAAAPTARLLADATDHSVDARPGTVSAGSPTAALTLGVGDYADDFAGDERAAQPRNRILTCAEFRHPDLSAPLRAVNDTEDRVVAGETYTATRFEAKLADDAKRRAPRAEISVGNVGRALSRFVEESGGGAGGTVRLFQVLDVDGARPDWELTLDVMGITGDSANVRVSLGFDPLLGRPAVALRYDPQTAPGLF